MSAYTVASVDDCPDVHNHSPQPDLAGAAFHQWFADMNVTHRRERCPSCGFLAIWRPLDCGVCSLPLGDVDPHLPGTGPEVHPDCCTEEGCEQ